MLYGLPGVLAWFTSIPESPVHDIAILVVSVVVGSVDTKIDDLAHYEFFVIWLVLDI